MSEHVVMKKSLAKALMDAGMHHFDGGGTVGFGAAQSDANPISDLSGALTVQNTYQAQAPTDAGTIGNQQATLAGQLQNESAGNGPNPAQVQYLQNAQAAAQQGANTYSANRALNPGLAARGAAQQTGATQSAAAAGAGEQQMLQQLAAQGQMAGLTGQEQTGLLGSEGINSQVSQNNANAVNNTQQGMLSNLPVVGSLFAKGGKVPDHLKHVAALYYPQKLAQGGSINVAGLGVPSFSNENDLPDMSKKSPIPGAPSIPGASSASAAGPAAGPVAGGPVASILGGSGAAGGAAAGDGSVLSLAALAAKSGGKIPGKASVKGNSYKNDTVPALVSPGEVVLPRSVTQSPDAPSKAAEFMKHVQKKDGKKSDGASGYEKVAQAKGSLKDRVAHLEKLCMGGVA